MGEPGDPVPPKPLAPKVDAAEGLAPTLPAAPPAMALPAGTLIGRYILLKPLGEGGMGVVYVAHDPELDRRVALKLLRLERSEDGSTDGRNRLVREAHAMAKLSHPNVLAIFDAGVHGEQVFLAMELIEGPDLWDWLVQPRRWPEILAVFLKAGRGLAAAHAAGLIHRDFKPANVLVGRNGEVKVGDFGLARASGGPAPSRGSEAPFVKPSIPSLFTPLTREGLVSGTPGYIAPEQLLGGVGDARSDEFSFCVALYEALYGTHPFAGRVGGDPGVVADAPKGTPVPSWLRQVLLRGLAFRPEDRFPTLDALVEALADDPAQRRLRNLSWASGALAIAAAAGALGVFVHQRNEADPCYDPGSKLKGIWDATVRSHLRAAFAARGAPEAAAAAGYIDKTMTEKAAAWLASTREACAATRVSHTQSEAALRLRLDCLEDQRLDLQAVAELLSHPGKDLSSVMGATDGLPLAAECADARALSLIDQPAATHRAAIEALRLNYAKARALSDSGQLREALELLKPLPEQARALDAHALEARLLGMLAHVYEQLNQSKQALELYPRIEALAESAHLDAIAAEAAVYVAWDKAYFGAPRAEVDAALERTRSDLRRAAPVGEAQWSVAQVMAMVDNLQGRDAEAATEARASFAQAEALFPDDSPQVAAAANNLAMVLEPLGQFDEMVKLNERVVARDDAVFGPTNARALVPQLNLAATLYALGRLGEAERALDRADARFHGEDRLEAVIALSLRAALQAASQQRERSLATLGRALDMEARLKLPASSDTAGIHQLIVEAYLRDGAPGPALGDYQRQLVKQDLTPENPAWVASLRLGGWAYLDAGHPKNALPLLEHALTLSAAHPFYPGWVPRLRWQLAKTLVATHGDRRRAALLAQQAHAELVGLPVVAELLGEVDAWRAQTFKASPAEALSP